MSGRPTADIATDLVRFAPLVFWPHDVIPSMGGTDVAGTLREAADRLAELEREKADLRHLVDVDDALLGMLDALIRDFFHDTPCSFDHHGYCQEHNWFGTETEGGRCPHARAREYIEGQSQQLTKGTT